MAIVKPKHRLVLQRHDIAGTEMCLLRIFDQTYRGNEFNPNGSGCAFSAAANGWHLVSEDKPSLRATSHTLYVRGSNVARDYDEITTTNFTADAIAAAVREYNAAGEQFAQSNMPDPFWKDVR